MFQRLSFCMGKCKGCILGNQQITSIRYQLNVDKWKTKLLNNNNLDIVLMREEGDNKNIGEGLMLGLVDVLISLDTIIATSE